MILDILYDIFSLSLSFFFLFSFFVFLAFMQIYSYTSKFYYLSFTSVHLHASDIVSHALTKKSVHFSPLLTFLKCIWCLFTWLWNYTWAFLLFWFGDHLIQSPSNPSLLQTIPTALFCTSWYIRCVIFSNASLLFTFLFNS